MRNTVIPRGALLLLLGLGISAVIGLLWFEPAQAAGNVDFTALEREIVKEVNLARTNPGDYAVWLRGQRQHYRGTQLRRPGEVPIRTQEGIKAVDEAIRFLERQKPAGALGYSRGLSLAARDLAAAQGASGGFGHTGPDGSTPAQTDRAPRLMGVRHRRERRLRAADGPGRGGGLHRRRRRARTRAPEEPLQCSISRDGRRLRSPLHLRHNLCHHLCGRLPREARPLINTHPG